ncbi:hypothetical protein [Flavobacterium sp. 102]|uniref:hypothetical protein n=1 Tax=Flavobacterium sp. 102 TaxID=2135623 RepID=UPI000EB1FDFE|nr:hypothetical protein [Flavobacterium sp. 102]RKS00434.1 hypothetical protein C8C84_0044 [Flavobacterium sp. 102]
MNEEQEAIGELKSMPQEELDNVPFQIVWWICEAKGCCRGTRVRDYGIGPEYWDKRYGFFSINERFILCAKHWKFWQRLIKNFDKNTVARKLFDFDKQLIMTDEERKAATPPRKKIGAPQMKRKKNR